jgi:anti-sigma factor RsiW
VTTEACREWRGALGAAALGAIDATEEIGLRAHLDGCAACRAELRDLRAAADALAAVSITSVISAPAEPSGTLGGRVTARVAEERVASHHRRTRRIGISVGALVAIAAVVTAIVLAVGGSTGSPAEEIVMKGPRGATATAMLSEQAVGTAIDVELSGLDPHEYYWLWLTGNDDDHRMSAGTFTGSLEPSEIRLSAALSLDKARRIWVTDEDDKIVLDARIPAPA